MTKNVSKWIPIMVIPLGGILMLGLVFLSYLALNMVVENWVYGGNPQLVRVDLLRRGFALLVMLLYFTLEWTKWLDWIKATILIGPFTMVLVTIVLQYTQNSMMAVLGVSLLVIISILIIRRIKRPWFYYYAIGWSVLAALVYAWPRA
jgi:hypothetical protein